MDPNGLLLIMVVIAAFYLLVLRPARSRQKQAQATAARVEPGVRVMTTAGLFGTVTAVDGDKMDLEIAPGVTVRYVTAAVAQILDPEQPAEAVASVDAPGTSDAAAASLTEDDTPGS